MRRWLRTTALVFAVALVMAALNAGGSWHSATAAPGGIIADNYIVTFKAGVDAHGKASEKARAYGLTVRHVYSSAVSGFAAFVPPGQLKKLRNDPDVATIVEDRQVVAFNDERPTGIRRSQADRNSTSQIGSHTNPIGVDVAVVDSGIDPDHPDLNVVGGVSCVPGEPSYADQNGHGTHVAGTIGALDNGTGVVGMAPGVRLWAVRVLNANGEGQFSDLICGIDWVTANAGTIEVVNMSLGAEAPVDSCTGGSIHEAICRSVNAGVTYVVAAGNSGADAAGFIPAAYPEVITVSAIVDTDGAPGGRGSSSYFYGEDDELANFSNYGAPVDIAAPGVDIYSTWPDGYSYSTGTSMASPHVAGAAAIYAYLNPAASPSDVRAYLLSIAWEQDSADGFTMDVDSFAEPLLNAGAIGGPPLPPPTPSCTLSVSQGAVGSSVDVACENFGLNEIVRIHWDSTATTQRSLLITGNDGGGSGRVTVPEATGGDHHIIALGSSSGIEVSLPFTVNPAIKMSTVSGKVGAFTFLTLSGFAAGDAVAVTWDDSASPVATTTASATGGATVFLTIPEATSGQHTLTATGSGGARVQSTFTVVPGVTLTPSIGKVGTVMTVNLRGYATGEQITVTWQNSGTNKSSIGTATASALGSASTSFTVPDATSGNHLVEGIGASGNQASTPFSVTTTFALSSASAMVGTNLTATLTGYAAGETVTVKWYDTQTASVTLTSVVTGPQGSKSLTFAIPEATNGSHRIEAIGTANGSRSAYVAVQPGIAVTPATGEAGTGTTAALTGFRAGEVVTVKWYSSTYSSTTIATTNASAKGSATASFSIPADATAGNHKVEAIGGSSFARATTTFVVASSGPPPPTDPTCSMDSATGAVGTRISVSCINFGVNETINLYWDDTTAFARAVIWTGSAGGGSAFVTVPDTTAGAHKIIALGATSGLRIEQTYTVAPSITLSVASAKVGASVTGTLKGFAANESVALTWDGGATLKTVTVNASGSAYAYFSIPEATRGNHLVEAVGGASALRASGSVAVAPSIVLNPTMGAVGKPVTATLRGYAAGEAVSITWHDSATATVSLANVTATALGSASANFIVPEAVAGVHQIDGLGASGSSTLANFTITTSLSLSSTTGSVGSVVDLTLTGFAAAETITVRWFETANTSSTIATLSASAKGSALVAVTVPESVSGLHKIQVTGASSGASAYQYFVVKSGIGLAPSAGPAGTTVTVNLTGYRAGETINVVWFAKAYNSIPVGSGIANGVGSASVSFAVPGNATEGNHNVDATGQSSYQRSSAAFTVTAVSSEGTPSIESNPETFDTTVVDDFSSGDPGTIPPGWSLASGSNGEISVTQHGGRLTFASAPGSFGNAWLIRDGATFSQADIQVQLRVNRNGNGAGVILAWHGPDDCVAVLVDSEHNRLDVIEVVGGRARSIYQTEDGSISTSRGRDFWLRAESGANGSTAWVDLYWSANGNQFEPIGVAGGLVNLTGGVGLLVSGANVPEIEFDDFVARRSQSAGPVTIGSGDRTDQEPPDRDEKRAEPTPAPTEDAATPEPVPTEDATATPEPAPTEEATATLEPEPTEEPTATPEPPPTDEPSVSPEPTDEPLPTSEPPPGSDATPSETG